MDVYLKIIKKLESEMNSIKAKGEELSKKCSDLENKSCLYEMDRSICDLQYDHATKILEDLKNKKVYLSSKRKKILKSGLIKSFFGLIAVFLLNGLLNKNFTLLPGNIIGVLGWFSIIEFFSYKIETIEQRQLFKMFKQEEVEDRISFLLNKSSELDNQIAIIQKQIDDMVNEMVQLEKEYENKSLERDEYISKREEFISKHLKDGYLIYDKLYLDGWFEITGINNEESCDEMSSDKEVIVPRLKHS